MRKTTAALFAAGALLAASAANGSTAPDTAQASSAGGYCHTLHHDHSSTYHHRYGRGRHAFGRCTTDWKHQHRHDDQHSDNHSDDH